MSRHRGPNVLLLVGYLVFGLIVAGLLGLLAIGLLILHRR